MSGDPRSLRCEHLCDPHSFLTVTFWLLDNFSSTGGEYHSHLLVSVSHHVTHRNLKTHTQKKHLRLLSSGTKLFITFGLKGFSTWGRQRHNLSLTTFCPPPRPRCSTRGKASASSESQPSSSDAKTQLTDFSQIPQILRTHFMTSFTSPWSHLLSGIFILTSLNDASSLRVHEHLHEHVHEHLHLTNPCTKRKVFRLTKPKGKICKTKSLGHYITKTVGNWLNGIGFTYGKLVNNQKKMRLKWAKDKQL